MCARVLALFVCVVAVNAAHPVSSEKAFLGPNPNAALAEDVQDDRGEYGKDDAGEHTVADQDAKDADDADDADVQDAKEAAEDSKDAKAAAEEDAKAAAEAAAEDSKDAKAAAEDSKDDTKIDDTEAVQEEATELGEAVQEEDAAHPQSSELARRFELARAAHSEKADLVSHDLFRSFRPCGQCSKYQRFGEKNDGGYLMCMDGLKKENLKAAYSLGVEHHDQWSEDVVSQFGVTVNQFDCTVNSSSCKGCKFFKKCIASADGKHPLVGHEKEMLTLNEVLTATNQANAPNGSLLMKMDIESSEWPIFAQVSPESLNKFGQLIVEFHFLNQEYLHPRYLKAMQHILASGFKVAHLHGNNYSPMYEKRGDRIPDVIEVTFVRSALRPAGCAKDQLYEYLDEPNIPNGPTGPSQELPMAILD